MTASVDRVDFLAPVYIGDTVVFLTCPHRKGTTSIKVRVRVEAERYDSGKVIKVTEAELTMVAVGPDGKSIPFDGPPSVIESSRREAES